MNEMPDILEKICRVKRCEIEKLKAAGQDALRQAAAEQTPPRGFRAALAGADGVALIAEVKKASPSAGIIRPGFDPLEIAMAYEEAGATAISVLTDRRFFQGETSFVDSIRQSVTLPLLRKDFILDEIQVVETRALGADAFLLIVAALEPPRLRYLMKAGQEMGMDVLVEVHDEEELATALDAGADLVGINNRDLRTFEVDLEVTERLAANVPDDIVLVGESGIKTRADVERLKAAGVRAVLVGETLMRSPDLKAATRQLVGV